MTRDREAFLRRYVIGAIRHSEEILAAEVEMFERVWYERKLVLIQKLRHGEDSIGPELRKNIFDAVRELRRRYGSTNLGATDDFERGMIYGKLSALRWVMGEEWDMLDT